MTDDIDTNSIAVAGIDIHNVASLEQPKRLTTFINHFIATTVFGLNQFSTKCIQKLDEMSLQLESIETQLQILEYKLANNPPPPSTPAPNSNNSTNQNDPVTVTPSSPEMSTSSST